MHTEDKLHPGVPLLDLAGAASMASARGLTPAGGMPSSARNAPLRLMLTPSKQQWNGQISGRLSTQNSPRIAAMHSEPHGRILPAQIAFGLCLPDVYSFSAVAIDYGLRPCCESASQVPDSNAF